MSNADPAPARTTVTTTTMPGSSSTIPTRLYSSASNTASTRDKGNPTAIDDSNYLVFAANRPKTSAFQPAALRPEGSTLLKARSKHPSRPSSSKSPSSSPVTSPNSSSQTASSRVHASNLKSPTSTKWLDGASNPTSSPFNIVPHLSSPQSPQDTTSHSQPNLSNSVEYDFGSNNPVNAKVNKPVGEMLPRSSWIPDSDITECQSSHCSATFPAVSAKTSEHGSTGASTASSNFFGGLSSIISQPFCSRRHHCRACGRIFCNAHSSNTLPLSTQSATSNDVHHLPPPPTTPGFTSPTIGGFTLSMLRRPSTPGSTTPLGPQDQSSPHSVPPLAFSSSCPSVVQARVCDECYISLQLAANVANFDSGLGLSSPSLSSSGTSKSHLQSRSHSPTQSQMLSRSGNPLRKDPSDQQEKKSGEMPPVEQRLHGQQGKPEFVAAGGPARAGTRNATYTSDRKMHPLDPRHGRLGQIMSDECNSGGSTADSSLAVSLGTTPGTGWTWSTF